MNMTKAVTGILIAITATAGVAKDAVLVVGGHPDDLVGSAGLCFLLKDRFDLHLIDYTRGAYMQANDSEIAKTRMAEERAACAHLGMTPYFMEEGDGRAFAGEETCRKMAELIGRINPRCVILHWPIDVHKDHMMSAAAALKAIEIAGIRPEILFFEETWQSKNFPVHYLVDITDVWDRKVEVIRCYKCQNTDDAIVRNKYRDAKFRGSQLNPPEDGRVAEAYAVFQSPQQGFRSILSEIPKPGPMKEPAAIRNPGGGRN